MDIKAQLIKAGIKPDLLRDQFFLTDKTITKKIVDLAKLKRNDVVLEIGAGTGNLTRELAKKAGNVIAFEIDDQFEQLLSKMPDNVEIHIEDVHKYARQRGKFRKKKEYNKIVSNIPYSIGEWLLHNLTFVEYDKAILLVAKKFAESSRTNPVFASFFKIEEKLQVPKEKFYPAPKTDSVVIDLVKLSDPIKTRDLALFLRQYLYQREGWKVKNSLREGLITYTSLVFGGNLVKRQAKKIIENKGIATKLLEKPPDNPEIYKLISRSFNEGSLSDKIAS